MSKSTDIGAQITTLRRELEELHGSAATPALGTALRTAYEALLVAEDYANPGSAPLSPRWHDELLPPTAESDA